MSVTRAANSDTFKATTPSDREIVLTRLFDAPRELVFEAMTRPEHVKRWWGCLDERYSVPVCEIDLRVGGTRKQVMRSPDGYEMALTGVFLEIRRPDRLVWRNESDDPARPPIIQAVTFTEEDGKTRWTLQSTMVSVEARDKAAEMGFVQMITQGIERLNGYLVSVKVNH